jgi:Reverse transcriptase (RNA-dependent DNA polymerase)
MDVILSSVKWKFCLVYLDDIIIYSPTFEKHVEDLEFVLGLLERTGVSLRLGKFHFFQKNITYLGHIVLPGKLQIDQIRLYLSGRQTLQEQERRIEVSLGSVMFIEDSSRILLGYLIP